MAGNTGPPSLKGKRKKKMPANANPLFTQWLQEWKDEANEKGWKSAHTYNKALKTLKLFPLPLETGKDCKLLQNFGDKICKMLDEKLAQYKLNGGVVPDVPKPSTSTDHHQPTTSSHTATTASKAPKPPVPINPQVSASPGKRKAPPPAARTLTHAHSISDDDGSDVDSQPPPQKQKRSRSSGPREYVPAYRSGPYALILSLYREMQRPGYRGYMLKTELIEAAQPLAEKSFTVPDPGSHYTAWSSMGTVIRKGLIIKYSNPAKFFLTEAGQELAARLEEAENQTDASTNTTNQTPNHRHVGAGIASPQRQNKRPNSFNTALSSERVGPTSPVRMSHRPPTSPSRALTSGVASTEFSMEDADLEAAINASILSQRQYDAEQAAVRAVLDRSATGLDVRIADEEFSDVAVLNASLDNGFTSPVHRIGSLDVNIEDTDIEAAIKASLELSSSQNVPNSEESPPCESTSAKTMNKEEDMHSFGHSSEGLNNDRLQVKTALTSGTPPRPTTTVFRAVHNMSPETTDISALDASPPPQTLPHRTDASSPLAIRPLPPLPTDNSSSPLHTSSPHKTNVLSPIAIRPLPPLPTNNSDNEDDDDEMKRAIAESLLSYSQEQHNTSHNPAPDIDLTQQSETGNLSKHHTDDSVLVVSDEEGVSVGSFEERLRRLSPKPELSSLKIQQPPKLILSPVKSYTRLSEKPSALTNKINTVTSHVAASTSGSDDHLVVISDFDSKGDDAVNNNNNKGIKPIIDFSDDDDELPDLDVPLFQRLLNRGNVQSNLLKHVAQSQKHSTSDITPASALSHSKSCDVIETSTPAFTKDKTNSLTIMSSTTEASSGGHHVSKHKTSKSVSGSATNSVLNEVAKEKPLKKKTNTSSKNNAPIVTEKKLSNNCKNLTSANNHQTSSHPSSSTTNQMVSNHASSSSVEPCSSLSSSNDVLPPCVPEFTLHPGTFDIVLCLDNREFYGKKSNSKTLLPDLMKSGIQCDLRLLHVGDLLWVARERLGANIGGLRGREVVLDYIVERKRMDDLVSSITDGRMKEQKFRLKHCGLNETIILIEEYGSIQNFSLSEVIIKQSIVNSQIIDGFKVKRCGNTKEAVTYLATMTRFLQQRLCNKTLHAVSVEQMKERKGQRSLDDSELYLAQFNAFNESSVKHKDLNVTELFGKMLIQVPGVSADRARAITCVYPTFPVLMEAYKNCATDKDREKLLATIKYGKNERNLGIAVSRTLSMLYTTQGRLS